MKVDDEQNDNYREDDIEEKIRKREARLEMLDRLCEKGDR
tara:strand:+ start:449 stop:568 length:120 start_codon:yes stop_codon:yes gene_type:complete